MQYESTGIGNFNSFSDKHWLNPHFAFCDTQFRRGVAYFHMYFSYQFAIKQSFVHNILYDIFSRVK